MKIRHTLVGIVLDGLDYLALGLLPVMGDIIDVIGAIYFFKVLGPIGLVSAVELMPMADVLPTNIFLGLWADHKGSGK